MLVTRSNFDQVVQRFSIAGEYGLDTETTGLRWKDRLFSVILTDEEDSFYFNFNSKPDHTGKSPDPELVLPRSFLPRMRPIFANKGSVFFASDVKYDMNMLAHEDLWVEGGVHCLQVVERLIKNNYPDESFYGLGKVAERRGLKKSEAVEEYIMAHKLYEKKAIPGKKKLWLDKHFDWVPFDVMAPYAVQDGKLHRVIGREQAARVELIDAMGDPAPSLRSLLETERRLIPVCLEMERTGILIDEDYTRKALAYEQDQAEEAKADFELATGLVFDNKKKTLIEAFTAAGEHIPTTDKGNPCLNEEALERMTTPVAQIVQRIREHEKNASTYYSSYLYYMCEDGRIRANMRQGGTTTGRFSYWDPNLQNVPKEDDEADLGKPFIVRSCFVPTPGMCFVPIDYQQQEFRLMLDYAGQADLIRDILAGYDPHTATAELTGLSRRNAKILNFGIPYGMGLELLAKRLGVGVGEAAEMRSVWFGRLPKVARFLKEAGRKAGRRGYVWNHFGRRLHCDDPRFGYKLANHIIQSTGADIIKRAMPGVHEHFRNKKCRSRMLIQVHDEILYEFHPEEFEEISKVKAIMTSVYEPRNGMPMDCSVEHSWKSWGAPDKAKGMPSGRKEAV